MKNKFSIQILGSSTVNLSTFNHEFLAPERPNVNLRRSFLSLFDQMKNEVVRLDVTLGISLLDRPEHERLSAKLEKVHPNIPNTQILPGNPLLPQTYPAPA